MRRLLNSVQHSKACARRISPTAAIFFRFGREPKGFDILPSIPGVDFGAAWEKRVETVIDPATGLKANFISAEDLITAKQASGRPQDLADVDAIRKAAESQMRRPAEKDHGTGRS